MPDVTPDGEEDFASKRKPYGSPATYADRRDPAYEFAREYENVPYTTRFLVLDFFLFSLMGCIYVFRE